MVSFLIYINVYINTIVCILFSFYPKSILILFTYLFLYCYYMHHPNQLNFMFPWLVNLYITNYNYNVYNPSISEKYYE